MRKRSTNHVLFELYLEKQGQTQIFDKIRDISLGQIVLFTKVYEVVSFGDSIEIVNEIRDEKGLNNISDIDEMDNQDFNSLKAMKALNEALETEEVPYVIKAVELIDEYYEAKRNEIFEEGTAE